MKEMEMVETSQVELEEGEKLASNEVLPSIGEAQFCPPCSTAVSERNYVVSCRGHGRADMTFVRRRS